ncbi:MAG TPA: MFS transporter [Acidobacteria bacterium]|jgi:UMF1 family MFS transporter|uniref:Major facilitator superfamily (MFS) profile domain-containing protein n=1 Tax=marine metagenome TaxID=408172 RepID=A0A381NGW5_9ZZZZ|nr:MFS transporter [Acidobacteriota bacterium]|tara:strand:- start:637 stop:1866 length:1230 start_codon:yes stop_codon:yes gene_type:complete
MNKQHVRAWALFDFANSVYPAVMTTAVFPVFYVTFVVGEEGGVGELWWGRAVSVSALVVAVCSPLLGAIADRGGVRKRFMLFYTAVCLVGVAMMSTLGEGMVVQGFVLFLLANVGFESALVFYNAYLPDIAPPEKQGWVSGLGFGVGYLGSALGLLMVLPLAADRIELVWPLVSIFFLVFALPAFLVLPKDQPTEMTVAQAARWGVTNFREIVREVWEFTELRNFLLAFFFYIDGVLTVIVMAGVVATETFGFDQQGTIVLFLIVQLSALVGAFALATPTDRYGPKRVLNGVLALWVFVGVAAYFIQSQTLFYGMAILAGLGLGSVQAASRTFLSLLVPGGQGSGQAARIFGFYALCGKASSVIGPMLFGYVTVWAGGNQRPAFLALTGLFLVGLVLLQRVADPRLASD